MSLVRRYMLHLWIWCCKDRFVVVWAVVERLQWHCRGLELWPRFGGRVKGG